MSALFHQPQTCFGRKVVVHQDQPRVQLGTERCLTKYGDEVEWVSPAMRAEMNAWLREFFGMTNLMKDGECFVLEMFNTITMNQRTYQQIRAALAATPGSPL